jgi:glycosyltransferase involved in cell wall biosynthesis
VPRAPKVTAVIATFNWATVLPYSIGSVLDQTFTDFELLVIGDGCSDESEQVVTAIADPRVQWINLPVNTGHQSGPNNEALRRARGKIVAHLGHDDLWLPRHLEHLVAAIDAGAAMAHGRVLIVEPHMVRATPRADWHYRPGRWIAPTSLAYRRDAALEVGGWSQIGRRVTPEHRDDVWTAEGELCQRVAARDGPPVLVERLTCIKFPTGFRRDVYRARPNHEQALWQSRIRDARDPEIDLLAFEYDAEEVTWFRGRAARSIRFRTRRLRRALDFRTPEQHRRRARRRKGLDP